MVLLFNFSSKNDMKYMVSGHLSLGGLLILLFNKSVLEKYNASTEMWRE